MTSERLGNRQVIDNEFPKCKQRSRKWGFNIKVHICVYLSSLIFYLFIFRWIDIYIILYVLTYHHPTTSLASDRLRNRRPVRLFAFCRAATNSLHSSGSVARIFRASQPCRISASAVFLRFFFRGLLWSLQYDQSISISHSYVHLKPLVFSPMATSFVLMVAENLLPETNNHFHGFANSASTLIIFNEKNLSFPPQKNNLTAKLDSKVQSY